MQKQTSLFFGKDIFAKAFRQFNEETFFDDLEKRVQPQSYYHKFHSFKNLITVLSYLFNLVSALTASYLVFWLTKWLTGITVLSYILSGIFLFFLEQLKRKSSAEFFQEWFFNRKMALGWLALSVSLFGASVASTYYGTQQATKDFAPPAALITQDSVLANLYSQTDDIEQNIIAARETRWKGTTTSTSQETVNELTAQKSGILVEIRQREARKDNSNEGIGLKHKDEIELTATTLAWITVLFEIFFECCIAYIWYFYYRSYIEHKLIKISKEIPLPEEENLINEIPEEVQFSDKKTSSIDEKNMKIDAPFSNELNGHTQEFQNSGQTSIGFFTKEQKETQNKNVFKQDLELFKQSSLQRQQSMTDLHTMPHKDFKTGKIRHVNLSNIENMISIYQDRVEEATESAKEFILENRSKRLKYWQNMRIQLLKKHPDRILT